MKYILAETLTFQLVAKAIQMNTEQNE